MRRTEAASTHAKATVETTVHKIIAEVLCIDESKIASNAHFRDDLGADSLDLVELMIEFGRVFQAEIRDEHVRHIATVGDAVTYLEQNLTSV